MSTSLTQLFSLFQKNICEVSNTQQGINYTATYLPSRKPSRLDELDMQDIAGEAGTSS